jgi:hypothetical protein
MVSISTDSITCDSWYWSGFTNPAFEWLGERRSIEINLKYIFTKKLVEIHRNDAQVKNTWHFTSHIVISWVFDESVITRCNGNEFARYAPAEGITYPRCPPWILGGASFISGRDCRLRMIRDSSEKPWKLAPHNPWHLYYLEQARDICPVGDPSQSVSCKSSKPQLLALDTLSMVR